jgi:hypothetical protein
MKEKRAAHGERMIEFRIKFWNPARKGHIRPGVCKTAGAVYAIANGAHGVRHRGPCVKFQTIAGVASAVEKLAAQVGVRMVATGSTKRYLLR